MVWEKKCATIVMLAKETEADQPKCHKYWPDEGALTYSNLQVKICAQTCYADYILREITLVNTRVS